MGPPHNKNKLKFSLLIVGIVLLFLIGRQFPINTEGIKKSLERFPLLYSGLIFIILYIILTFFIWLSKDIFKILGALIFGVTFSTLFIWIAETINACILFNLTRVLGRGFVENALAKGRIANLDRRLAGTNFFWLFMFRAVPLIPFRFLDLACGLTSISFRKYLAAVILGSLLRIFWVQHILAGVGVSAFNRPEAISEYFLRNRLLLALSLIYLILIILVGIRIRRKP